MMRLFLASIALALSIPALAEDVPDCSGANRWPARVAEGDLARSRLIEDGQIDYQKTTVNRITSQKTGKDLYRQVHLVRFVKKTGEVIAVITVNDVSHQECSMSSVDVYPKLLELDQRSEESGKSFNEK
jgi:hypothetical protein